MSPSHLFNQRNSCSMIPLPSPFSTPNFLPNALTNQPIAFLPFAKDTPVRPSSQHLEIGMDLWEFWVKLGGGVAKLASKEMVKFKSYQNQANLFLKEYLLADPLIPYTSIIGGIFACKMVYDLTQLFSTVHFKSYSSLTRIQRVEWNNRSMSTIHAIFITTISLYLVFCSNLYSDNQLSELITFQSSSSSTFALGVSVGYFIADLGMIFWFFPSLGGYEYVIHHLLSLVAVSFSMLTGEGQLYTYMVLISETTTPGINLRWYLDAAGMKKSNAYLINGVVIVIAWLVARILLFVYMFYHVYLHFDQIEQMHVFGQMLVIVVPLALSVMNLIWFSKIIKGLRKTLAKRQ
ncbi:Transmembrane protein 56-B isoform D [Glycine soja]|uniref:Transmembrane protein 56-B isoform C n=2 Tax=Glycine soja TaxID=3848 RepID=A0A445LVA9_GLYSO|nr:Transmembrane protein 56-B isoform C [Glycine soja]RZC27153.1 Transmembrane protein 56-B isoform D [Glycine soja]